MRLHELEIRHSEKSLLDFQRVTPAKYVGDGGARAFGRGGLQNKLLKKYAQSANAAANATVGRRYGLS